MKSTFNQRWIIAGAIWLAALILSFWNLAKIETVAAVRENCEQHRLERRFQHRHSDRLDHIHSLHATYYKPAASPKLGFESVRNPLNTLAALFGMEDVVIEPQMVRATQEQIPFTMRMTGDHKRAMGFATALSRYPYISIDHSRIVVFNSKGRAQVEMELTLKIKIVRPNEIGSGSFQAAMTHPDGEIRHQ